MAGSSELMLSLRVCGGRVETEAEEGVMAEDWSGEMVLLFLVVVEGDGEEHCKGSVVTAAPSLE